MPKPTYPEEVFNELMKEGAYEEAHFDKDEVRKVLTMAVEDYAKEKQKEPDFSPVMNALS